jgi:hypothetical protein
MGLHGEVTVWYMTEEERLAYIKKHPIIPTEKPKGVELANITDAQYQRARESRFKQHQSSVMDKVNKVELHKLYMDGEKLKDIAKMVGVTVHSLDKYIRDQREINPDKWPYRTQR